MFMTGRGAAAYFCPIGRCTAAAFIPSVWGRAVGGIPAVLQCKYGRTCSAPPWGGLCGNAGGRMAVPAAVSSVGDMMVV